MRLVYVEARAVRSSTALPMGTYYVRFRSAFGRVYDSRTRARASQPTSNQPPIAIATQRRESHPTATLSLHSLSLTTALPVRTRAHRAGHRVPCHGYGTRVHRMHTHASRFTFKPSPLTTARGYTTHRVPTARPPAAPRARGRAETSRWCGLCGIRSTPPQLLHRAVLLLTHRPVCISAYLLPRYHKFPKLKIMTNLRVRWWP